MKKISFFIFILFPIIIFGQNCNCKSNYEWTKKTFEENDAGFQFTIDNKGKNAYQQHNIAFDKKISTIEDPQECTQAIYEWMTFFRSGHISIRRTNQQQSNNKLSDKQIIYSFKDWEKIDIDLKKFQSHLKAKNKNDFEGIWVSQSYKIGVKKVKNEYVGFIIEGDGVYWVKGQVKFKIKEDLSSTYYMKDHSVQNFESVNLLGDNYLDIGSGFITFKRIVPKATSIPQIDNYIKAISSSNPYFQKIDETTVLLRIPRFGGSEKNKIDSVINTNKKIILETPNLIIDIRNNGGGSDRSFQELLPLLYTNPIRTIGTKLLSTPQNNQRMLDFINKDEYGLNEEDKKWAQKAYDTLSKHIGEFVMLNEHSITETKLDTIHNFPKNIGIIINENNGSTTEQFLLAAKQSKKVKLFGTTTAGVLDISNMYYVKSPCEEYELGYSLSKSMRIPEMTIDNKGIQPDYYINKEIPKYEWTQFVTKILNE